MKLDLDTSNLNWENATVRDYRYIHHLMMMIHERWSKLGISPSGPGGSLPDASPTLAPYYVPPVFSLYRYAPGGILTWDQLCNIYHAMVYLGVQCYFNPDNFKESNWVRGDNRKLYRFNLNDMCEIADFDFFANPFIPGQPIDYYSKFLYPIKKVLAAYKKIASDYFIVKGLGTSTQYNPVINARYNDYGFCTPPQVEIDGKKYDARGKDRLDFYKNKDNLIKKIKEYYNMLNSGGAWDWEDYYPNTDNYSSHDPLLLGYEYSVNTTYEAFSGYGTETDSKYKIYSDLIYRCIAFNPGTLVKSAFIWPEGTTYEKYLCHTTYSNSTWAKDAYIQDASMFNHPKYFDSPWGMIINLGSGTVPANGEVCEFVEIPNWDQAPLSHAKSSEGERYISKYELINDGESYNIVNPPWYGKIYMYSDHYAAFYYPLFVFDVSPRFEYL